MSCLHRAIVPMLLALAMTACDSSEQDAARPPPPPVEDTVFGDLVATKDRAKQGAEQAMEQRKQELEEAMKKVEE
jgi:hypothetical protein